MKTRSFLLFIALFMLPFSIFAQTKWTPYSSEIAFKIKNAGATVTGRFQGLKTTLVFSADKLSSSSLKGSVEVATIKTGIDKRDKDLLDEKYFDAGKYKEIEIHSTKLYKKGAQYAGMFSVTIKGKTKEMEIPFEFKESGKEATFNSSFNLNRKDFNVGGNNPILSDDLTVTISIKAKS